jgi:hypothetical protein
MQAAIAGIGGLTLASDVQVAYRMPETLPPRPAV